MGILFFFYLCLILLHYCKKSSANNCSYQHLGILNSHNTKRSPVNSPKLVFSSFKLWEKYHVHHCLTGILSVCAIFPSLFPLRSSLKHPDRAVGKNKSLMLEWIRCWRECEIWRAFAVAFFFNQEVPYELGDRKSFLLCWSGFSPLWRLTNARKKVLAGLCDAA